MKLNAFGRIAVNSPARAAVQRRWVSAKLQTLGGELLGCDVLEMGCGRGVGIEIALNKLGAARVDAFDIDPRMIRRAQMGFRGDPRVRFWLGDAVRVPVPNDTYDAVLDFGTLYLIDRWQAAVEEVRRVLRPAGRFLFEVPACALTRFRDPLVTSRLRTTGIPFGRAVVREIESHGFTVRFGRLRFAGTIQLAGDLIGVATKVDTLQVNSQLQRTRSRGSGRSEG